MPKKVVKHLMKNKEMHHIPKKDYAPSDFEKILVENFVSLQKVIANLSEKFDGLTKQLSKLLELFEVSAKSLAERNFDLDKMENQKIITKIDNLLEQNKIIARGLTLIHGKISEEPEYPEEENLPKQEFPRRPQTPGMIKPKGMEGYQKSISSEIPSQS